MKRAILLSLLALALPASAQAAADPGVYHGDGVWTYPGQRLAHNPSVDRWMSFSEAAWVSRGLRPCTNPTVYLADDLGDGVAGRATSYACDMWILVDVVRDAQQSNPVDHVVGQLALCVIMQHEDGHLAGLSHSTRGIMSGEGDSDDNLWFVYRRGQLRARANGLCASAVAADYNAAHPLRPRVKAGRRVAGRFQSR